ncbi:MAG: ATP-binding cassette domain-containing protein, partial [Bacteroidota bacterium]
MPETIVELRDVAVFQKENMIFSDISLDVKKGEFVYVIGKTGSGKSSFMKTLYADLPLRKGKGSVVDFDLEKLEEKDIPYLRRKLGIVFQ